MESSNCKPYTYVLSHLAKYFMTDESYDELLNFFKEHNIPDGESFTLYMCEEAECELYHDTADKLQGHLTDLIRVVWGDDADAYEDFPEIHENEIIPTDTECIVQIDDDTIENFAKQHNLDQAAFEKLQTIISENEDYTGSTDGLYLELKK
jgi:hypothetical protein